MAEPTTPNPLKPGSTEYSLVIVDPDKVIWEGKAKRLIAPGVFQDIAILPDHTPLYAQLRQGAVIIDPVNAAAKQIPIDGGIIRVKSNQVSIIVGFETKDDAPASSPPTKT